MQHLERKEQKLKRVKEDVLSCRKCLLSKARIYPVIGEGSCQAKILFCGEAPGSQEDKTGRPFCGAAGRILDELLKSAGIKRKEVYITNLLKCRPPDNRDPQEKEIESCLPYLERQIELIEPEIICPLGRHSMRFLMKKFCLEGEIQPISKIHGKVFKSRDRFQRAKIIPLYHPAVAVYNPNMKEILKKDFQCLKSKQKAETWKEKRHYLC